MGSVFVIDGFSFAACFAAARSFSNGGIDKAGGKFGGLGGGANLFLCFGDLGEEDNLGDFGVDDEFGNP